MNVLKATPTVSWPNLVDITYGTPLDADQQSASASVPGTFRYSIAAGTVLPAGPGQTISVTFTPTDAANYNSVTLTNSLNVVKATPLVTWTNPADITYGTALGAASLTPPRPCLAPSTTTPAGPCSPPALGQTLYGHLHARRHARTTTP